MGGAPWDTKRHGPLRSGPTLGQALGACAPRHREQTLFRSTQFGDDVDRPLVKSDGGYTYFASDIAYHKTKIDRGFTDLVDVWGADHGGYVKRMQAAVTRALRRRGDARGKALPARAPDAGGRAGKNVEALRRLCHTA